MKYIERRIFGIRVSDLYILVLLAIFICFVLCLVIDFHKRNPISPQNVKIRIHEINSAQGDSK